jgi:hypothetical protein
MGPAGAPLGPPFDIPDFTLSGVLPPFLGTTPTVRAAMSPYETTLTRIAQKLCGSDQRREIFRGLLRYRRELSNIGVVGGLQWLSGSFMEDIETLEKRHPNDVDVVTFVHRPVAVADDAAWQGFIQANIALFVPPFVKPTFRCDPYFVELGTAPENVVNQARYWFGLFSHRRGGLWKGLLQIPLAVTQDDVDASALVGP